MVGWQKVDTSQGNGIINNFYSGSSKTEATNKANTIGNIVLNDQGNTAFDNFFSGCDKIDLTNILHSGCYVDSTQFNWADSSGFMGSIKQNTKNIATAGEPVVIFNQVNENDANLAFGKIKSSAFNDAETYNAVLAMTNQKNFLNAQGLCVNIDQSGLNKDYQHGIALSNDQYNSLWAQTWGHVNQDAHNQDTQHGVLVHNIQMNFETS